MAKAAGTLLVRKLLDKQEAVFAVFYTNVIGIWINILASNRYTRQITYDKNGESRLNHPVTAADIKHLTRNFLKRIQTHSKHTDFTCRTRSFKQTARVGVEPLQAYRHRLWATSCT